METLKVFVVFSVDVLPGDVLSYGSIANCRGAIQCLEDHPEYDKIVFSGGVFRKYQKTPVSVLMKQYLRNDLLKLNISRDRIILERESKDTYQNLWMTISLLKEKYTNFEIVIVSHWIHALRARYILWRRGVVDASVVFLHYPLSFSFLFHEVFAWMVALFDKEGTSFFVRKNREKGMRKF